jgi:hypothetical protein
LASVVAALALLALLAPASQAAGQKLSKHDRECLNASILGGPETTPTELSTPIEAPVLASFGVLRRPAIAGDAIPALSPVGNGIDSEIASWYPAYTRRVTVGSVRYYLIPVFLKEEHVPPASCLSPRFRAQRPEIVELARKRASELSYCLVPVTGEEGPGGGGCEPFADLGNAVRVFLGGGFGGEATVALVPDGVASVRISFRTSPAVTATVGENLYAFKGPASVAVKIKRLIDQEIKTTGSKRHISKKQHKRLEAQFVKRLSKLFDESEPTKVEWLDANGALVRLIGRPKGSALQDLLVV